MTIAFVIALVFLALVAGYAARQMQELREKDERIEEQRLDLEKWRGKPSMVEEQAGVIEVLSRENDELLIENAGLRQASRDHESNLEMVLDEMDKDDQPE